MNVLITGVSKGIGLALTNGALEKGYHVYGVARHPGSSKELSELQKRFSSQLTLIELDLTDAKAQDKLVSALKEQSKINILINNAGIYENGTDKQDFLKSFEVNSYIPFMVTETLLSKLKAAGSPKVIHITSLMGSISDNTSGGSYAYRSSKTALNMIHKCLSIDHPWLTSCVIHPGWVQTSMGGESAPVKVHESGSGIWKVIEELKPSESGCFKDYQGRNLPW